MDNLTNYFRPRPVWTARGKMWITQKMWISGSKKQKSAAGFPHRKPGRGNVNNVDDVDKSVRKADQPQFD